MNCLFWIFSLLVTGLVTNGIPLSSSLIPFSNPTYAAESDPMSTKKDVVPLVGQFQVQRFVLNNGLRLLVVEDHSSPTFAYQTWFRVGSRNEKPKYTGLAHLFEHLMFKETKNMKDGEFDRLLEGAGVEGENAFTSRDYTAYIQELPKTALELIAKAESDRMVNLMVNEKAFKTEREVVQNERRYRTENNPDGQLDQEIFSLAFKKHPYHWPVIGYSVDLERMKAQDALDFYHSYYSPNHATVVVVGDVDADQVYSVVQKFYGHLKTEPSLNHIIPVEPPQKTLRQKKVRLNIQIEKLLVGYHIPGIAHEDIPALKTLQAVLTGGKSSRLQKALVDSGIASSVDTDEIEDKDPSLFVFSVNLQKNKHATQAEAVIQKELNKLMKERISEQELARVKNGINFSYYENLNSNFTKAYFLGHNEAEAGNFTAGIKRRDQIQAITPLDIQAVARRYFDPKGRTVIIGVPK